MYLQINAIGNGERCIWNATIKGKNRIQMVKKLGYPPFEAQNNPIFVSGLILVQVQEKINIRLSVSNNYFLLYFDICMNIQGFVNSEFCKYWLGLRRSKHVLTKCNSCLPAIQWFYIKHCPSFHPISKLGVYLSVSRVSKIFPSGPLLIVLIRKMPTLKRVHLRLWNFTHFVVSTKLRNAENLNLIAE